MRTNLTKQFKVDVSKLVLIKDASVGSGYRFKSSCPTGAGDADFGIPASLYEVVLCREVGHLNAKIKRQEVTIRRHERNARRRRDRRAKKK